LRGQPRTAMPGGAPVSKTRQRKKRGEKEGKTPGKKMEGRQKNPERTVVLQSHSHCREKD